MKTVNPVFGVIYDSQLHDMFVGSELGSFKNGKPIYARKPSGSVIIINNIESSNNLKCAKFLEQFEIDSFLNLTSSIKMCRIAEGLADVYPLWANSRLCWVCNIILCWWTSYEPGW